MPIPEFNEHGLLPDGVHECDFPELEARFGQNRWVPDVRSESRREVLCPNRAQLCGRLHDYLTALRRAGLVVELLINGSFVTDKPDPNDIDLIVVLPAAHDFSATLPPQVYDLLSKRRLSGQGYPFDLFVAADGDTVYQTALILFRRVRDRAGLSKGLLRVRP